MAVPSFTELALNAGVAADSLAECAFAFEVAAVALTMERDDLEHLAARVGLSADATLRVLSERERCLALLRESRRIFSELAPHEAAIRSLTEERGV